jgi:hypothetical protein
MYHVILSVTLPFAHSWIAFDIICIFCSETHNKSYKLQSRQKLFFDKILFTWGYVHGKERQEVMRIDHWKKEQIAHVHAIQFEWVPKV